MKILSFNVNGIRAVVGKSFISDMQAQAPDVICLQETKATPEQVAAAVEPLTGYQVYANSAERKGYSGTAILTKIAPHSVTYDIGLQNLERQKPVVVCGDFNVAHHAIDLARPKENYNKAAGYMQEEIDGMNAFAAAGLLDTFRTMHPDQVKYSWWSYRAGAREKNVGWRIDYFLVSKVFLPQVKEAFILNDVFGSDHCPVGVVLA